MLNGQDTLLAIYSANARLQVTMLKIIISMLK